MTDEKRKYHRVSVKAIVIYQILDHIQVIKKRLRRIDTPDSVDISVGGLQVITKQKLSENMNLKIDLSILPTKIPIEVYGKVAWSKVDANTNHYRTGIEFTKFIDEKQKELIDQYIDSI